MPPNWCARKVGRILGAFAGLLTVVKGLALAYAKDLQEDKEPVFAAADALDLALAAMAGMISDCRSTPMRCARGREGLSDRDRSRRLDGAPSEKAVPRSAHIAGAAVARPKNWTWRWTRCRWRN